MLNPLFKPVRIPDNFDESKYVKSLGKIQQFAIAPLSTVYLAYAIEYGAFDPETLSIVSAVQIGEQLTYEKPLPTLNSLNRAIIAIRKNRDIIDIVFHYRYLLSDSDIDTIDQLSAIN